METLIAGEARALCRVDEIADGDAKGFPPAPGGFSGLVVWRDGDAVRVYVNSCPHIGTPLDWLPDRFLARDGRHILCSTHGALFRIADGFCLAGPCAGARLRPVATARRGEEIYLDETRPVAA
jgi:nitrite reductase/ring-hydroxylating ferredoxin subunit